MTRYVFKLNLTKEVKIVDFSNDWVLLVIGESREVAEVLTTGAIDTLEDWVRGKKRSIVHHKT